MCKLLFTILLMTTAIMIPQLVETDTVVNMLDLSSEKWGVYYKGLMAAIFAFTAGVISKSRF